METLFKMITDNIYALIVLLSALGILGLVLVLIKKLPEMFINILWNKLTGMFKPHRVEFSFNRYSKITDELTYLIDHYEADRAIILEFHNGSYYASKQPMWKLTHTHGKARLGIENEELNIKSLPVSLVWDVIGPLVNKSVADAQGMTKLEKNQFCTSGCNREDPIYLIEIEKISSSFSKYFLNRGTNFIIATTLLNSNGNSVGLLILEFLDNDIITRVKKNNFSACEVCNTAKIINSINEQ